MLHHLAYIVCRSNQLQRITKEESKPLLRWHIGYILGTMFLVVFLMIIYDVGVHQGAHILPNVECTTSDPLNSTVLSINGGVQKSIQVVLFTFYLYYKYQLTKNVQNPDMPQSQEKLLHTPPVGLLLIWVLPLGWLYYFMQYLSLQQFW